MSEEQKTINQDGELYLRANSGWVRASLIGGGGSDAPGQGGITEEEKASIVEDITTSFDSKLADATILLGDITKEYEGAKNELAIAKAQVQENIIE